MQIKSIFRKLLPTNVWRWMSDVKLDILVVLARIYHWRVLLRIRRKVAHGEKIRVAFVESEIAKWKTQSLFNLMKADEHYEPFMLICMRYGEKKKSKAEIRKGVDFALTYFKAKGNECVDALDYQDLDLKDMRKYKPDLVFYQQSWYSCGIRDLVKYALPCYVPYYVANYGSLALDSQMLMHRFLAYFFMQSVDWVHALTDGAKCYFYSGKQIAVGHTALDYAYLNPPKKPSRQCVIYAPHFSFITKTIDNITGISTFPWSGLAVLEYAQKHPEMNWVFKPHPLLHRTLVDTGYMRREDVDAYYVAWAALGRKCEDSDYAALFNEATVMITDCGSFLTEFGSTGKPIIHLISSTARISPMIPSRELYSTYYQVHDLIEMSKVFELILEKQEDPNKEVRQAAVRKAGLTGNYAAKNIMEFFDSEFGIKRVCNVVEWVRK